MNYFVTWISRVVSSSIELLYTTQVASSFNCSKLPSLLFIIPRIKALLILKNNRKNSLHLDCPLQN